MYLYSIHILFENSDGEENSSVENQLEDALKPILKSTGGEVVTAVSRVPEGTNFGKCCTCGCWASDWSQPNRIPEFSNGAKLNGAWYCDLCLPPEHPNAF